MKCVIMLTFVFVVIVAVQMVASQTTNPLDSTSSKPTITPSGARGGLGNMTTPATNTTGSPNAGDMVSPQAAIMLSIATLVLMIPMML